jgi:predicted NBD/HSP70 family sugar kinase
LINEGFVEETGVTSGVRPGKPATSLAVREDSCDIIALDLSAQDILRAGVYSLRGEKRAESSLALEGRVAEEAVDVVLELIQKTIPLATHRILGIGIGSPGIVDDAGTVLAAPNLNWREVNLQEIVTDRFGFPAVVQNDANAAVMAEKVFAEASPDLVRVQISRGVGAGVLLKGSLVLGSGGAAGEIGHLVIEHKGLECSCGKQGCLETWISVPSLRLRLESDEAHSGTIMAEAGRRLGMALAPIVAALDLQHIIVGGPLDLIDETFINACQSLIIERTYSEFRRELSVKPSSLGHEAVLKGAVSLVLRATLGVS